MSSQDETKKLLENILSDLYQESSSAVSWDRNKSYLLASDGQFLGEITSRTDSPNSILNQYSPYGSQYSNTSIFNPYSLYGSRYGAYSINNPYCTAPPKLIINGKLLGRVTNNNYITNKISTEAFLYTLKNHLDLLLQGHICESEEEVRCLKKESFIIAADGQYLGSIKPSPYDQDSIFNTFSPYGSKFSQTSIYNKFSPYGSSFSPISPYNTFSTKPPKVYVKGRFTAYLTNNRMLNPQINPDELKNWAQHNVSVW